jgi:GH15 family glucan-1,4-alpha-glucosidase
MTDLRERSIEIIKQNQSSSGAYPASPNFLNYRYCWFRDSAFIAYAMDLVGEFESSSRFHEWAATNVNKRRAIVRRAIESVRLNEEIEGDSVLHTRYSIDGENTGEDWPNFQLDGFGTWLWSLNEHQCISNKEIPKDLLIAANLVADYIAKLWKYPCFDCWEEFPKEIHTYTLAAIYAGLRANESLNGKDHGKTLTEIKKLILDHAVADNHFVKFIGSQAVDAVLLGISTPFGVISADHPLMKVTAAKIDETLRHGNGGVHRYAKDTYYGGGEWVLLTAWLGWYYVNVGEIDKAENLMCWVEARADDQYQLPEQIPVNLNDSSCYEPWRERWGEIANPLLWSHAKYIILKQVLMRNY